jgi:hypothetical protein
MMLVSVVSFMILAVYIGKKSREFGIRQVAIIILIAIAQAALVLYDVFTKQQPPAL